MHFRVGGNHLIAPCTSPYGKEMILCCLHYDESIRSNLFSKSIKDTQKGTNS